MIEAAQQTIERLHPGYAAAVRDFIMSDPLAKLRCALDIARIREDARPKVLCLGAADHPACARRDELRLALVPDIEGIPRLPIGLYVPENGLQFLVPGRAHEVRDGSRHRVGQDEQHCENAERRCARLWP